MPVTGAAVGLDPMGFAPITEATKPERIEGPLVRHVSPGTGDYELTSGGRRFGRTTSIRQRVYLALATRRGESPTLQGFGLTLPGRINDGAIKGEVRRALNQLAVVEQAISISSIVVTDDGTLGRINIHIVYVPVGQRETESVTFTL